MTHLASTLPRNWEIGAQRRLDFGTEIVRTDSGAEVRNNRWAAPLRAYDLSFPIAPRETDATYQEVLDLYEEAQGSLHSFDIIDWTDGATVAVRFDGPLAITGVTPELDHIVEVTLVEVRDGDTSP